MNIAIIGASNIDIQTQSKDKIINGDSNIGTHLIHFGGVGRNIAINLSILGHRVLFFTNNALDALGKSMYKDTKRYVKVLCKNALLSNIYLSIFDHDKDLYVAIASMNEDIVGIKMLLRHHKKLIKSDMILTETNMSEDVLAYISRLNHPFKVVELVSITKALKIKSYVNGFHYIKGNKEEIKAVFDSEEPSHIQAKIADDQHVIMTSKDDIVYDITKDHITSFKPEKVDITNTSGAGDGFLSGYLDGIKDNPLKRGFEISKYVLQSHESTMKGYNYDKNSRTYKKST